MAKRKKHFTGKTKTRESSVPQAPLTIHLSQADKALDIFLSTGHAQPLLHPQVQQELSTAQRVRQSGKPFWFSAEHARILVWSNYLRYFYAKDSDQSNWTAAVAWARVFPVDEADEIAKEILRRAQSGEKSSKSRFFLERAMSTSFRYEIMADPELRSEIITELESHLNSSGITLELRPHYQVSVAAIILAHEDIDFLVDDCKRAVAFCRLALAEAEGNADICASAYSNLGKALMLTACHYNDKTQAREAVQCVLKGYNIGNDSHLERVTLSIILCNTVMVEYQHFGPGDVSLETCRMLLSESLSTSESSPSLRSRALNTLGLCDGLMGQFKYSFDESNRGDPFSQAIAVLSADDPFVPKVISNLACQLLEQGRDLADETFFIEGIRVINGVLQDNTTAQTESNLWNNKAQLLKELSDLNVGTEYESAIDSAQRGIAHAVSIVERNSSTLTLADCYLSAYERSKNPLYLDAVRRIAVDLRAEISVPGVSQSVISFFSSLLGNISLVTTDKAVLDECINVREQLVSNTSSPAQRSVYRRMSAGSLRLRFLRTLSGNDLHEASVQVLLSIEESADPLERLKCILEAGLVLSDLFEFTGDLSHLLRALKLTREITESLKSPLSLQLKARNNIGMMLRKRYEYDGDTMSLNESIDVLKDCVRDTPLHDIDLPSRLGNLANAILTRARTSSLQSDISDALAHVTRGLNLKTSSTESAINLRLTHALATCALFEITGEASLLNEAVAEMRKLLEFVRGSELSDYKIMSNLALSLISSMAVHPPNRQVFQEVLDLQGIAVRHAEEAGSAQAPTLKMALATIIFEFGRLFRDPTANSVANRLATEITQYPFVGRTTRVRAHKLLGEIAASESNMSEAANAYGRGIALLAEVAWPGLDFTDRHKMLDSFSTLARDGAACAISNGDLSMAVEFLEMGRGVVFSQILGFDVLGQLQHCPDRLAEKLSQLDRAIIALDRDFIPVNICQTEVLDIIGRRTELALDREYLLNEIRALPGNEQVGLHVDVPALLTDLGNRNVALINVSVYRCDALIVGGGNIVHVPLPGLTMDSLQTRAEVFIRDLGPDMGASTDFNATSQLETRSTLVDTLDWLWTAIADPVTSVQAHQTGIDTPRPPRLWWCPTGPLALLPLHASCSRGSIGHPENGETVSARVVSSYASTIRALVRSVASALKVSEIESLIVSVPRATGLKILELTEIAYVMERLPKAKILRSEETTRVAVLASLAKCNWMHFAGHAVQDLNSPELSCLKLHDEDLSIRDLAHARVPEGGLIFLSACSTAQSGLLSPDESLSLASATAFCGFAHVIGTKWPISDSGQAAIAEGFYRNLVASDKMSLDTSSAAFALHTAVNNYRSENPRAVMEWAAAIHIGA